MKEVNWTKTISHHVKSIDRYVPYGDRHARYFPYGFPGRCFTPDLCGGAFGERVFRGVGSCLALRVLDRRRCRGASRAAAGSTVARLRRPGRPGLPDARQPGFPDRFTS